MRRTLAFLAASAVALAVAGCGQGGGHQAANQTSTTTTTTTTTTAAISPVAIPLVGCPSDGQQGPEPAPPGAPTITVSMDPAVASQLALYTTGEETVLAPRGWHCLGMSGSDGSVLTVTPNPMTADDLMATRDKWASAGGDVVQVQWMSGDTSGRFAVAKAIAAFFPARHAFLQSVIDEGIDPASDFMQKPAPTDRVTPRSANVVEYETPAGASGVGTALSWLKPGSDPIEGAAVLQGATPDLQFLAVRLPPAQKPLAAAIVALLETAKESDTTETAPASSGPPPPPSPPSPPGAQDPVTVVRAFYAALGQADGDAASGYLVPEKRATGAFSPAEIARFYGSMSQPIQLASAQAGPDGAVEVRYTYVAAGGHACNGAAEVRTASRGGQTLISGIKASGC